MATKRARVKKQHTRKSAAADFSLKKKLQRKRAMRRHIAFALLGVFMLVCGVQLWQWQHNGKLEVVAEMPGILWHNALSGAGFSLQQVTIKGRKYVAHDSLTKALNLTQGSSIFSIDLSALKQAVEAISEVRKVTIRRVLPSELQLTLYERTPAVIWQKKGQHILMDAEGVTLNADTYGNPQLPLVVVGDDAPEQVAPLLALLKSEPSLMRDVRAAVRIGLRRWNLVLKNNVTVMLPEVNPEAAWKRFAYLVKDKALLTHAISIVDLRLQDRVFITPDENKKSEVLFSSAKRI